MKKKSLKNSKCKRYEAFMQKRFDGTATPEENRELDDHLCDCPHCFDELTSFASVRELLDGVVDQANEHSASYERVTKFALLPEQFSQENGRLTPTMKVRRKTVAEAYKDRIELLYEELEGEHAH